MDDRVIIALARCYTCTMQLRAARLCLNCEEIHDARECPVCSSNSFVYISRWVPTPERRQRPRPAPPANAETYRQLLATNVSQPATVRWVKRGALGVAVVSVAGWLWRRRPDEAPAAGLPPPRSDERP